MFRTTNEFFAEERTRKMNTGSLFLEAIKVHMTRVPSFCKLKMLRHAQIQIMVSKVFQKTAVPVFYKRERYTKFLLNQNVFSQRMGASALRLRWPSGPPPFFRKKHFYWQELL